MPRTSVISREIITDDDVECFFLVPHSVVSSTGPIRGCCKSISQSVVFYI